MDLTYLQSLVLGVVEGVTEFLPISSTGHLRLVEGMFGMPTEDPTVTAFTAVIQVPAIIAALVYFRAKIARLAMAFFAGLVNAKARKHHDWTLALAVIVGSIPVGLVGFLAKGVIEAISVLWVVGGALIAFSGIMWLAERRRDQLAAHGVERGESDLTVKDGLVIGLAQCLALIPGVSRSGATISFGLFQGITRVVATELSFFLAIPALVAAGVYETVKERHGLSQIATGPMVLGLVASFVVAYASIAWLLRFVATNSLRPFVVYRVVVGVLVLGALAFGWFGMS